MIWLTFPGQNVPGWLERVEVLKGGYFGGLRFSNFNLIWKHKGKFHVVGLLNRPCLTLVDSSRHVILHGQGAGVRFHESIAGRVISIIKRAVAGGSNYKE